MTLNDGWSAQTPGDENYCYVEVHLCSSLNCLDHSNPTKLNTIEFFIIFIFKKSIELEKVRRRS